MQQELPRKVLLISPPSRSFNHYRPPLALMYLSGYLKHAGVPAAIIDIVHSEQIRDKAFFDSMPGLLRSVEDRIIARASEVNADIIGITCYTPEFKEVEQLALRLKSIKPDARIVVGGVHPTLHPEHFFYDSSPFDFAVVGEGEITLLDLVRTIREGGKPLAEVPGIAFFDRDKKAITINERRPIVENLDDIAFPDYEDLDMDYYTSASPYSIRGVFTRSFYVMSSRGCPSSCTFCVSKKLRNYHGARHYERLRSPESLFSEIRNLKSKYLIDAFYFIDDLFTLKKDNVRRFCELLVSEGLNLVWACSSKVNTVDYDTLALMRKAGCIQIDFGVEKGSDRALAALKKGITVKQVAATFDNCRTLGIRTFANILVNTPGETSDDLNDICNLLDQLKPNIVSINVFTPYPGCEIYEMNMKEFGKDQYSMLMRNPIDLVNEMPDVFRFAVHDVDIGQWTRCMMQKYNLLRRNVPVFFDYRYLRTLVFSARKFNYVKQLLLLVREFINQKF